MAAARSARHYGDANQSQLLNELTSLKQNISRSLQMFSECDEELLKLIVNLRCDLVAKYTKVNIAQLLVDNKNKVNCVSLSFIDKQF